MAQVTSEERIVCLSSLVPRPFHVFQCARENSVRPGRFGDVMMTYLPPFLLCVYAVVEMVADMSSLYHEIDQALPIFLVHVEKHGYEEQADID